ELTRRELDVLTSLCRPALSDEAFVAPATAREIATDLVVTEAAVKQHLLRLYQKFRIPEGPNRRVRLANEVVALGLVRPLPPAGRERARRPRPPGSRARARSSRPARPPARHGRWAPRRRAGRAAAAASPTPARTRRKPRGSRRRRRSPGAGDGPARSRSPPR